MTFLLIILDDKIRQNTFQLEVTALLSKIKGSFQLTCL
jgi:hypothetical protein